MRSFNKLLLLRLPLPLLILQAISPKLLRRHVREKHTLSRGVWGHAPPQIFLGKKKPFYAIQGRFQLISQVNDFLKYSQFQLGQHKIKENSCTSPPSLYPQHFLNGFACFTEMALDKIKTPEFSFSPELSQACTRQEVEHMRRSYLHVKFVVGHQQETTSRLIIVPKIMIWARMKQREKQY